MYLFPITQTNILLLTKGSMLGHLEPTLTDDTTIDQTGAHPTNSVACYKK